MTEAIFKSRRDFLAGTAAAITAASLPRPALAASAFRHFAGSPLLVLYQPHDAHASAFAGEFHVAGFTTLSLTDDPVRQWRDGLGCLVRDDRLLLLGLTNWSDYFVLRGLAAEERRFPLFECCLEKAADVARTRQHARDVLALAEAGDARLALRDMNSHPNTRAPALFSWAI